MSKQGNLYWGEEKTVEGAVKRRPFLVLSKNEANKITAIVAPVRSVESISAATIKLSNDRYPFTKKSTIDLSQIKTIKVESLKEEICQLHSEELNKVKEILGELLLV